MTDQTQEDEDSVGKASRRKRERHEQATSARKQRKHIAKIDQRGRKVGSTLADYEALCAHGPERVAEALIARHTKRMDHIRSAPDLERLPIMEALVSATTLDIMLYRSAGASVKRPPQVYWGSWADRLAWGVDSCAAAARLLLSGQVVGAAVVARTQLERWTFLRAAVARLKQEHSEETVDYIARVWSTSDAFDETVLNIDSDTTFAPATRMSVDEDDHTHDHIVMSDGFEVCPAMLWAALSEMLHGRHLPEAISWDSTSLLTNEGWTRDYTLGVGLVCETIRLCLRQLRLTAADLFEQSGDHSAAAILLSTQDEFSDVGDQGREAFVQITKALWRKRVGVGPETDVPDDFVLPSHPADNARRSPSAIMFSGLATPPLEALIPLTPNEGLHPAATTRVVALADDFTAVLAGKRPAGRLYRDDELTARAFAWHRARSVRVALMALQHERQTLGESFNIHGLTGRSTAWTLASETASLVGGWTDQPEMQAAARLMGTGLRSAAWLWLEDDDRAMSVLRVVLEQSARLRTWRLKPEKAARLEARGSTTTPRDWLEAAGWRRLGALNRALGEFAHALPQSDWSGARDLLSLLQDNPSDPDAAIYTTRGAALELLTHVVADEVTATIASLSPQLAHTLTELFKQVQIDLPLDAEARLNHIWTHRSTKVRGSRQFAGAPGVPPPGSALIKPKVRPRPHKVSTAQAGVLGTPWAPTRQPADTALRTGAARGPNPPT